ncbi:cell division transport system ATP-binding protein [Olsenella profusa DSM 13989]|uniref:cell division ATP-binding protein FtsE n=1 Tax=Olsenella profusa TaxID=138595 RepID=UPI0027897D18|nr:cell division ATP-binding protein FtsE [Olsenella profusa]MDP9858855.1 cell division transport system ATP-binding protein [Olsenella profusa DSM 13989]
MANHFRSSERQGDEKPSQQAEARQQDEEPSQQDEATSKADAVDVSDAEVEAAMADLPSAARWKASSAADRPSTADEPVDATSTQDEESDADGTDLAVADDSDDITAQPGFTSVFAPLANSDAPAVDRSGTPTISLRNVTHIYPAQPNKPALEDVSLDIYPGEFVFVVGHSGSGKSTFLRLLTRELRATSGKVMVAGQELTRLRNRKVPYLRRQIGTVYQDFKLLPDKTVYENVSFALECIGKPRSVIKAQVPEVLRLVGLAEKMDNYPDQLSGGEQQRVSVARAMVNRPPLLVCDEPTGNLDPAISLGIMKLLDRINRTGTTVVMATHDREMVDSMRKRVIALEAGHIVRDQERGGYGNYGVL